MRKTLLSILLILGLFVSGCSFVPVNTPPLKDREGVRFINPNEMPVLIDTKANKIEYTKFSIDLKQPCRVKYHWLHKFLKITLVSGRLQNGNRYPILIDSGSNTYVLINDLVVLENDIAIF